MVRGVDRSERSLDLFYQWLEARKAAGIRLAVMDIWRAFNTSTERRARQSAILYDMFHMMRHLGKGLDTVRKQEYRPLADPDRSLIKGQKYTVLSRKKKLTLEGRRSLKTLFSANKRLNTVDLLKESFGHLWEDQTEGWAKRFFENWKALLKWQRLKLYEEFAGMIERHWDGIAVYVKAENKVSRGFVEGLNKEIRMIQIRVYGFREGVSPHESLDLYAQTHMKNTPESPTHFKGEARDSFKKSFQIKRKDLILRVKVSQKNLAPNISKTGSAWPGRRRWEVHNGRA
ncbi:MAG TPA: transposase [Nitrospirales bacterium]|nr:transposase [Nitrospirales bacterium]